MASLLSGSTLNGLLDELAPIRQKPARFLLASATLIVALLFTGLAQVVPGSTAELCFALAVIASTCLFGFVAGLCTAVLATLMVDYFFIPPSFSFNFDNTTWRTGFSLAAIALVTGGVEKWITARIRKAAPPPPLGVHGTLDGLSEDGDLFGWAFDADHPDAPVKLTLFADNRALVEVAAVYPRPDVATSMGCSGRHGFYIDASRYLAGVTEAVIDVRLENGRSLEGAPRLMQVPVKKHVARPTVLFMHIPKTAGTAFREAILANFNQSEIAYLYPTHDGFLVNDLRRLPLDQRRAFRMVVGHFQYGMHEALPQAAEYITIVREPGDRVLSHYAYLQQTRPELISEGGRLLGLAEVFERRLTVEMDNSLVRHFGGVDEGEFPAGTLTEALYERALRNLARSFAFVGYQDESAEAYRQLRQRYGWDAVAELRAVNPGKLRERVQPDAESMAMIGHYNCWDYRLYEEIKRLFPRRERSAAMLGPERLAVPQ